MLPFYIIFFIIVLLSFCDVFSVKREQKLFFYGLLFIIMAGFAGLRFGDQDYFNYIDIFAKPSQSPDIGFAELIRLVSIFSDNSIFLFLFIAVSAVGINFLSYKKLTPYFFFAVLFYFVHAFILKEMIQIRAGLACALCLFSFPYLDNAKYKRFFIIMFLAISIHLSAIVVLFVCFAKIIKLTRRRILIVLGISLFIGIICPFGQIIKALPGIDILSRAQTYNQWEGYNEGLGILNPVVIKQILVIAYSLFFFKNLEIKLKGFSILLFSYLLSTCWLIVWNDFAIIGARVATFFSIAEPILLSSVFLIIKPNSKLIVGSIAILIALTILYLNLSSGKIMPYSFVL